MASGSELRIDPDGVRAAGSTVATASQTATARTITVSPCAADMTSVSIANALSTLVAELIAATAAANNTAAAAASRLGANATTYQDQERANATALQQGATTRGVTVPVADGTTGPVPVPAQPMLQGPGARPGTGKQIAALIHQGPGPAGLDSAAALLDSHAAALDDAATAIRSGRSSSEHSWDSAAAGLAHGHLRVLEASYVDYARQARALSADARAQAENFRRARSAIASPAVFDDLERRLRAANAANSAPGSQGRYTAMVTKLQTELSAANQHAVQGFNAYSTDAQLNATHLPPASAEPEGADHGPGVVGGAEEKAAGLPGDGAASESALGAPSQAPDELMQTVLPAVLGAVAGAAGALLGALSGVGEKLQQTGGQLAGGLLQGAGQAMSATSALQAQNTNGLDPAVDGLGGGDGWDGAGVGDAGGGSVPGDTEPASAPGGPLSSAPASAAAAPAVAAPTYSSAGPAPTVASSPGVGMPMGAMMPPPMMGSGRGSPNGGDDRRLYPEKRLHLPTPPNSEPVKGRREARESRSGTEE